MVDDTNNEASKWRRAFRPSIFVARSGKLSRSRIDSVEHDETIHQYQIFNYRMIEWELFVVSGNGSLTIPSRLGSTRHEQLTLNRL